MTDFTLYQELIIDHWRHPRHFGELVPSSHTAEGDNPICGDKIKVYLKIEKDKIIEATFKGEGCAIVMASASLMMEQLQQLNITQAKSLFEQFHHMMVSKEMDPSLAVKLQVLANVKQYPMRIKCATLPWHTFKAALDQQKSPISTEHDDDT